MTDHEPAMGSILPRIRNQKRKIIPPLDEVVDFSLRKADSRDLLAAELLSGAELLDGPGQQVYVAVSGEAVIGYVQFREVEEGFQLLSVFVDKPHRRRGVGTQLVLEPVRQLRRPFAVSVEAVVPTSNNPLRSLLRGVGYASRKRLPKNCCLFVYRLPWQDDA